VYFPGKGSHQSGDEVDMALAPLLDMFNHAADVQVEVGVFPSLTYEEGVYTITSVNTGYNKFDQVGVLGPNPPFISN
jgi:hypothetical protein